jgi:TrmH family RNA methyltransferase
VRELFLTREAEARNPDLVGAARRCGLTPLPVTERVMASLRDTVTPQGVAAVVQLPASGRPALDRLPAPPRLAVLLDRVADPGNAGTVIRTADAAGADAVLLTAGSVDVWSGKCVRAAAGSHFHLPVVAEAEPADVLAWVATTGCQVLATSADGTADLDEVLDAGGLTEPTLWAFGNEAHGISDGVRAAADQVVRVPLYGAAESLNLAATAAICLYASARAQRAARRPGDTTLAGIPAEL